MRSGTATSDARDRPTTVTLTGPESTGKSTLALSLASAFDAATSAEAARLYADARRAELPADTPPDALLGPDDVERIARAQLRLEADVEVRARGTGARLVVRDTDLVSTLVYARHYYGATGDWSEPAWIEAAARDRRADLYLLCDVDLAWMPDGQRDRPHARGELLDAFVATLDALGCRWTWVRGTGVTRARAARDAVEALLGLSASA